MQSYLENILGTVRSIRDALMAKGPSGLRSASDILKQLADGASRVADYIEQFGPLTQFQKGHGQDFSGGVDSDKSQQYLAELSAIRDEAIQQEGLALKAAAEAGEVVDKQLKVDVHAGLLDWANKIDPRIKSGMWSMLVSLLTKVLIKSALTPKHSLMSTLPLAASKEGKGGQSTPNKI